MYEMQYANNYMQNPYPYYNYNPANFNGYNNFNPYANMPMNKPFYPQNAHNPYNPPNVHQGMGNG